MRYMRLASQLTSAGMRGSPLSAAVTPTITSSGPHTAALRGSSTASVDCGAVPAAASASASPSEASAPRTFVYAARLRYTAPWRSKRIEDFLLCRQGVAVSIAHTYRHTAADITVTLIPLRHFAHPEFFKQVDDLCAQHESVLMEGRVPLTGAPHSTIVPPRQRVSCTRPVEHEDDEGWEPREVESFFQPFSWGVLDSPYHTVVHAADKYDYERLPWWCSVRFNAPVVGSLAREQHCLNMVYPLRDNHYKSFAIPWGAAHMPVFHEMLMDNGFELVGMCSLLLLNPIDGSISEGEYGNLERWQRKRARRVWYAYAVGLLALWYVVWTHLTVEYRSGPRED